MFFIAVTTHAQVMSSNARNVAEIKLTTIPSAQKKRRGNTQKARGRNAEQG
jgi:hypothetical protein